ncbi:integral membrane protein [Hyaloscypha variabilis F]|uniref:Integral membrane protein n=1 Tax=Hyaloscypha variabilis (strain UAMH 11265 / GT02V1 / F) TaxID=1149755 RepID=A0A2J6S070_HYAVF|nr:integral membrane protein [Hyaloscypha variabilis F]
MAGRLHQHRGKGEEFGPFTFLNPTSRRYPLSWKPPGEDSSSEETPGKSIDPPTSGESSTSNKDELRADEVSRLYRSRDNRKGRHAIVVTPAAQKGKYLTPQSTSTAKETLKGIWRMFSTYPYWDVSYLVAVIFTLGSVVWCINAFFVWLPLQNPSTEFPGEIADAGGITAFIGATIFEIGSVLLMIEAVNENRADCFGWALEEVLEENGLVRLKPDGCTHHHKNKKNFVGKGPAVEGKPPLDVNMVRDQPGSKSASAWTWFPTWHELTTHYFKEVGFLACSSQMIGATVFWISGFTALPPIYNRLTTVTAQNGAYWLPQVIGGTGFIVSGTLFMLETQQKWYLPAYNVLGWHIGVWNLIGGIGFTLCGALGFGAANSGCVYQGSLATFWGSWCFLIGSTIQWFEALDKHPVDIEEGGGRVSDTQPVA